MSQKELNYIEDIIKHEKMIIEVLECSAVDNEGIEEPLQDQINAHEKLISKFTKLLGGVE